MTAIKVAAFNAENLFERPKVFNFKDKYFGDEIMQKISNLKSILKENLYTQNRKDKIINLHKELKEYIYIREDRGKLFKKRGWKIVGVRANGISDWDGSIEFKKAKYSDMARKNTAKVIKSVDADITCVIEADNRISLKAFDASLLNYKYKYEMLIDANDRRGIDVGVMSKYNFGIIKTHIYDRISNKRVFSRDCLELEVKISEDKSIFVLVNHFKSKAYDPDGTSNAKRKMQATRVKEILNESYDLDNDLVIVAGDLNDTPNSDALSPLTSMDKMFDVLELKFGNDFSKRWTYHYNSFEQIDYLLISEGLKRYFKDSGVERRGIYNLKKLTTNSDGDVSIENQFDTVTHWTNQASDHGSVWVEFDIY